MPIEDQHVAGVAEDHDFVGVRYPRLCELTRDCCCTAVRLRHDAGGAGGLGELIEHPDECERIDVMCAPWWSVGVKPLRAATSTRVAPVYSDLPVFERSTQESRNVWLVTERSPSFGVRRVVVDLHMERRTRLRRCESRAKLLDPVVIENSPGDEVAVGGESVTPLARC